MWIYGVAGLLIALAGMYVGWNVRKVVERLRALENFIAVQKETIAQLSVTIAKQDEIVKRRQLPYAAKAGLEDSVSIGIDLLQKQLERRAYDEYEQARLEQLTDLLRQVMRDPQHYDINQPDKPAGGKS
jgi:hypothetical protein